MNVKILAPGIVAPKHKIAVFSKTAVMILIKLQWFMKTIFLNESV
jgi:hypothetical protein